MNEMILSTVELDTASGPVTVEAYFDPSDTWNGFVRVPHVTRAGVDALIAGLRPDDGDARVRMSADLLIVTEPEGPEPTLVRPIIIDGQIVWPLRLGWTFDAA